MSKLRAVWARLFEDDAKELEARAEAKGSTVTLELRMLVRDALKTQKKQAVVK